MKTKVAQIPADVRGATVAIISGSGLGVVPDGVEIVEEMAYERLGWPATSVAGHPSRLLIGRWTAFEGRPAATRPTVVLACGRPHRYEGWSESALRRPVDDLAAWGVRRLVVTNASGGLGLAVEPASAVIVDEVLDLQEAPCGGAQAPRLPATGVHLADAALEALGGFLPARRGRYVAVAGPQYETPAEAVWLAAEADVVGMSTANEVRTAGDLGLELCVVSLVVNRSGASIGHAEVLAAGARLGTALKPGLAALLRRCWPDEFGDRTQLD